MNFTKFFWAKDFEYNVDKFGKDPNHNVLYIVGLSGSGKTYTAERLADSDTDIVNLDEYNNDYLSDEDYYYTVDRIIYDSTQLASILYPKRKLIVEGIQLIDMHPNFFKDYCLIVKRTNILTAFYRKTERDRGAESLVKTLWRNRHYLKWYIACSRKLNTLVKSLRGDAYGFYI